MGICDPVRIEILPLTMVDAAFTRASRLASITGVSIVFSFNDKDIEVHPGSDSRAPINAWYTNLYARSLGKKS